MLRASQPLDQAGRGTVSTEDWTISQLPPSILYVSSALKTKFKIFLKGFFNKGNLQELDTILQT